LICDSLLLFLVLPFVVGRGHFREDRGRMVGGGEDGSGPSRGRSGRRCWVRGRGRVGIERDALYPMAA
jgi:hypothetical protein